MIAINHPFFNVYQSFLKLSGLLGKHSSFGYLDYERYYYNGYTIGLHQIPEFSHQIVKAGLMPNLDELYQNRSHLIHLSCSTTLPECIIQENVHTIAKKFDIYHRLCIMFNTENYVEAFVFGLTKNHKNFIEIFINEMKFLEKFCVYFRENMHDLIEDIAENKIQFDHAPILLPFQTLDLQKENNIYQSFLTDIKQNKFSITTKHGTVLLSKREFECLLWMTRGKTAKQIARMLSLSPRSDAKDAWASRIARLKREKEDTENIEYGINIKIFMNNFFISENVIPEKNKIYQQGKLQKFNLKGL